MKSLILLFLLTLSSLSYCQDAREKVATESASRWLTLIDGGDYASSWDAASPMFKKAVAKSQWENALQGTRAPLGKLVSREVQSAEYKASLPGVPDGQYVVIQFETSFENKKSAIETITQSLDADGKWKAAGYFVR